MFLKILILAAKEIIEVLKDTRHIYVCEVGDHVSKVYLDEMKNLMKKNEQIFGFQRIKNSDIQSFIKYYKID